MAAVQQLANAAIDRIRKREGVPAFELEQPPLITPTTQPLRRKKVAVKEAYRELVPNASFFSNTEGEAPRKRQSRGAKSRAEKERARAIYASEVQRQQSGIDLRMLDVMDDKEVRTSLRRALHAAADRNSGRPRSRVSSNPWSAVHLSNADVSELIEEAKAAGHVFYQKPKGWVGSWPFAPSPDRKNPADRRYVRENLRLVPWILNRARGDAALSVVEQWVSSTARFAGVKALTDCELIEEAKRRQLVLL